MCPAIERSTRGLLNSRRNISVSTSESRKHASALRLHPLEHHHTHNYTYPAYTCTPLRDQLHHIYTIGHTRTSTSTPNNPSQHHPPTMSQPQPDSTAGLGLPQVAACLLVGYFVFRWFFKTNDPSSTAQRRPPAIDPRRLQQQVDVIRGMFPQIPTAAVQAELIRNGGSIEITTEKILTNGFLPEVSLPLQLWAHMLR